MIAIADAIEERLGRDLAVRAAHVEGRKTSEWILLDYIDIVVHVFVKERRAFYRLERLWGDAPRLSAPEPPGVRAAPSTSR